MSWFRRLLGRDEPKSHRGSGVHRKDGVGGWYKDKCHNSKTGWAWVHEGKTCTCQECAPPREEK